MQLYCSFVDSKRMKGWVGLVSWPTTDGLPIQMVTHQLQVRCAGHQGKFAYQRPTFYHWATPLYNQLSKHTIHIDRMAGPIAASTFNRLGQYSSSPGNRAYCYAELAVSSLSVTGPSPVLIVPTHWGWPGWVGMGGLVKYRDGIPTNGHQSQY